MQAVSNKYFRLIYNLDRTESVRHLLNSHNVFNIDQTIRSKKKTVLGQNIESISLKYKGNSGVIIN